MIKFFPNFYHVDCQLKDEEGRLTGVSTSNLLIANSGNDLPVSNLEEVYFLLY